MDNYFPDVLPFLRTVDVFSTFSDEQLKLLMKDMEEVIINRHEFIIHENETTDTVYVIKEGEVEVCKYDPDTNSYLMIEKLGKGSLVGEFTLLDNKPRSASVRALTPTILLALPIKKLRTPKSKVLSFVQSCFNSKKEDVYSMLMQSAAKNVAHRIRDTNDTVVYALKNELAVTKARVEMGKLIINTFALIAIYVFVLRELSQMENFFSSTTFISVPLIFLFAIPMIIMMKMSGYPLSMYGLTLKDWKRVSVDAILYSIPLLLIIVIYKWILIHHDPAYAHRKLFDFLLDLTKSGERDNLSVVEQTIIVCLYLLFVPLQELMVRGILQSSFQEFLIGTNRIFWAIILSNLLFSMMHVYISAGFGMMVYIPGIFWGWLYSKQRSLVGVIVSHLLIGAWAIFIVSLL